MMQNRDFQFKKVRIEKFIRGEYEKRFPGKARISVRKRQRFREDITRKIGKKFGKDVLCLINFNKDGLVSLVSPALTQSTEKGRLFRSFSHPQVYYTSHCLDRFSERTDTRENCIALLDVWMTDAILTYGVHDKYLICPAGVFAYHLEDDQLIVKTYINYELLSDDQIREFYTPDMETLFADRMISSGRMDSDFILMDEWTHPAEP